MKIGNLTKAAMFVALMMGQVTPPSTNDRNFYEEDGDFSSVSTVLHDGWGWGLNKAHAFCDTFEGTDTNCAFGGEPDEETSRYDEVTYESGGDAPAPTEPTIDEQTLALLKEIKQCFDVAKSKYVPCVLDRNDTISYWAEWCHLEAALLGGLTGPWIGVGFGVVCKLAKEYDLSRTEAYCLGQVETEMLKCMS